ncbi:hypothetical protein N7414_29005 [Pseudomonas sp. GD04087]|uniref:hypothetical protein n=1 Tax=unclassified Pseudomonas TaxID=196821 RepID=UPI00244D108F|nr:MULTISPECIES: hypothetical protein [unclassified Pseudomonas]MDH0293178.1 hypothetical protein [Pseudomonas sp. GD04087]MDH1052964.1 hypothetical protein [Pseudomonas sp. GD03903]MDH2003425.1 hypothetical protein [Pseudomonas sp. GD03691]
MNFFNPQCQSGPYNQLRFGVCDDQNSTPAYVDFNTQARWIATIDNPSQQDVTFTAIDKCVLQDNDEPDRGRCDAMLTTNELLYLVELKDQRAHWKPHAVMQLLSTIQFLYQYHPTELNSFRVKKAFACNKRRPAFAVVQQEVKRRFWVYGFYVDIQANVLVLPAV